MEVRCVSNRVCTVDKAGVRTCDESIPDAKKTLKGVGIENLVFFWFKFENVDTAG